MIRAELLEYTYTKDNLSDLATSCNCHQAQNLGFFPRFRGDPVHLRNLVRLGSLYLFSRATRERPWTHQRNCLWRMEIKPLVSGKPMEFCFGKPAILICEITLRDRGSPVPLPWYFALPPG